MLATDGIIRWQGQPVGRIVAAEEVLKPRVRIIADEQLTGAPRDSVQARLDAWLKAHIEKLLGPLFQLANAEDVTGLARGIAFQLAEALGVIERGKIADDVKSLDQPARASLRKYGVRFGAYHIYVPALLKPAPRVLATQLYALKHEGAENQGLEAIQQLAASGRTSIAADKTIAHDLYRIAGFRRLRRARGARRHPRAARRHHPPGARLASGRARPAAGGRRRWLRLRGDDGDDVARRLLGRGFRVGAARARLSHGEAAEAAAGAGARADAAAETPAAETPATEAASGDAANAEAPSAEAAASEATPADAVATEAPMTDAGRGRCHAAGRGSRARSCAGAGRSAGRSGCAPPEPVAVGGAG